MHRLCILIGVEIAALLTGLSNHMWQPQPAVIEVQGINITVHIMHLTTPSSLIDVPGLATSPTLAFHNCTLRLPCSSAWSILQEPYDLGDAYAQVAIGTDDVYKTAESVRKSGGKVTKEPQEIASIGTKITATTDPDGWKVVFVDNQDFLRELK